MIKVAILYVALGKYIMFWSGFYESAEKNFLPNVHKEYFVFTNHKSFKYSDRKNVHIIPEEMKPWPYATLNRYDFFLHIEDRLSKFDYLFFFNANALIVQPIHKEILPSEKHDGLVCVRHAWFIYARNAQLPFERRPESTAYVPFSVRKDYVWASVNGGTAKAFLEMSRVIAHNTKLDSEKGITAIWHDESHFNRYIVDRHPLLLDISYAIPEEGRFGVPAKIFLRYKGKYEGGIPGLRSM